MFGRLILYGALALALGIVVVSACGPQPEVASSPTATPTASASRTASPRRRRPLRQVRRHRATERLANEPPRPRQQAQDRRPPRPALERPAGTRATRPSWSQSASRTSLASTAWSSSSVRARRPGPSACRPTRSRRRARSPARAANRSPIIGNALFGARFQNASTQNPNGTPSYTGSNDIKPTHAAHQRGQDRRGLRAGAALGHRPGPPRVPEGERARRAVPGRPRFPNPALSHN